ncbi:hypothetical protein SAMN04487781_3191 [Cellulosimicrobium cellulans]|nr:hypothetical protein SAMN04487781_3191 [Cellulosimicrobium cellulans]
MAAVGQGLLFIVFIAVGVYLTLELAKGGDRR